MDTRAKKRTLILAPKRTHAVRQCYWRLACEYLLVAKRKVSMWTRDIVGHYTEVVPLQNKAFFTDTGESGLTG